MTEILDRSLRVASSSLPFAASDASLNLFHPPSSVSCRQRPPAAKTKWHPPYQPYPHESGQVSGKTRKKPCRAGTIVEAVGNREWTVKFDGKDVVDEEIFSSQKLQINQEAYGHHQEGTPPPSPSRNISQTSKPTGKKAPRELRDRGSGQVSYKDNGSDDDDDYSTH